MALDFSEISKDPLKYCILPRLEPPFSETLAPTIHSMISAHASTNPVQTRCIYSARLFRKNDWFVKVLPCCGVLIHAACWVHRQRRRQHQDGPSFSACPFCFDTPIEQIDDLDLNTIDAEDRLSERYIRRNSYLGHNLLRIQGLHRWVSSSLNVKNEIMLATAETKNANAATDSSAWNPRNPATDSCWVGRSGSWTTVDLLARTESSCPKSSLFRRKYRILSTASARRLSLGRPQRIAIEIWGRSKPRK